ncbi:MAG: hypothetical protein DWQ31_03280 [Planctomycetota bacterium]|nr:MAG: hypothetical protein DWQ31_03280 [Planctomycetota bacterium]REJ90020.1 MAG: hypothetical protein DWQ35_17560 [Planctomycetota bacterium]REK22405.1 MAG: hypothetical protein DWQ42_17195 [Planctomycetota bacterium]REK39735.1 MAG: hypothetical protein DWQ46_17615 [Planctomycetota bacterium]
MFHTRRSGLILAVSVLLGLGPLPPANAGVRADLSGDAVVDFATTMDMPFMDVGNLGNLSDVDDGYGGVDYAYRMGKFEVTAGQYTEFLNAVAADDTYGLYNARMADPTFIDGDDFPHGGANIQRAGSSGSYTYSVAADWADRPVNYVSWGDVARFANWLTNGMPSGGQTAATTEDGTYPLNGATSSTDLKVAIAARKSLASGGLYFMPSEDEWYKAAFHKNDGDTANYFTFATSSDSDPGFIADGAAPVDPDVGNVATYDGDGGVDGIGAPYYRTEAGEHENTPSPYGTFDMDGNIGEWTEGLGFGSFAIVRGGDYVFGIDGLKGDFRRIRSLTRESGDIGFRLASFVADPTCIIGDVNCDGFVDISNDILPAFTNFTGPGSFGKDRSTGDVHGPAAATTDPIGHDGDVDVSDILTIFGAFTGPPPDEGHGGGLGGPAEAGDPSIPDLIYDAATGEVTLDADGSSIIGYSLQNASNSFLPAGHTPILAGVTTALTSQLEEAALAPGSGSIGLVFPTGLNLAGLQSLLTVNQVSRSLGAPLVPFDLIIVGGAAVPEPSTYVLSLGAFLVLVLVGSRVHRGNESRLV